MRWHEWSLGVDDGWAHHGLAVLDDGTVVGYHPRDRELLFFDRDGSVIRRVRCDAVEAHDIVVDGDTLWLTDTGNKLALSGSGKVYVDPPADAATGQVLQVDLDGRTLRRITRWHDGPFSPTGLALDDRGVWIADGYGSNRVDLLGPDDAVLITIDGLDCPHGIAIDRRGDEPLLYVAERGAHRIAVYDMDGSLVRYVGEGDLLAPCAMATKGDRLYVADLVARMSVFDAEDRLIGHVGADGEAAARDGWPNAVADGRTVPPPTVPQRFNSPHGIVVSGEDVVITEWLLGGRWIRLGDT